MESYTLIKNSNLNDDIPIAIIKNGKDETIDFHKTHQKKNIIAEITSESDIFPLFYKQKDQNIRIYIAGASGVGKSHLTAKILESYVKVYKDQRIIIFSAIEEDKAYDENSKIKDKIERILVDNDNIAQISAIKEEDLANSICVFDDFRATNKLDKIITDLKNAILRRGRHYSIDSIIINDKLLGSARTITELNHANYIIFFPVAINEREIKGLFNNYLGLDVSLIPKMRKLNSRWVMISKNFPRYCISQHSAFLIG